MLNFGWAELMVIGVVALIVIGPEDLPAMFRQMGRFTAKLRQMSREFSRAMEQAGNETGVKDVARDLKNITSPKAMGLDAVKSAADKFEKWDPIKSATKPAPTSAAAMASQAKPLTPPPMPATPAPAVPATPAARLIEDPGLADDIDPEALDDLFDLDADPQAPVPADAVPASSVPAHGPATQALYDKQAAKAAVIAEQTAKLRAIDAGTYQPEPTILPPTIPSPTIPSPTGAAPAAPEAPAQAAKRASRPKAAADGTPAPKRVAKPKAPAKADGAGDSTPATPKAPRKSSKKADPS